MRRVDAKDGIPLRFELGIKNRLMCCDCSLVHDFIVKSQPGGTYTITFFRNQRLTRKRRKEKEHV
jgi:hypothetical protein